jgi:hypothetical protein
VIKDLVEASGHRYVLFKPLCESDRVVELVEGMDTPTPGRAVWAYRSVDGRVRSALAKFGANNLLVLREIAAGGGQGRWQAQGLSDETRRLIESFDYSRMSPESAAALFWYVRNSLYFEQDLQARDDVTLVSYDATLADPETNMRALCAFLDFAYHPRLVAHMEQRTPRDLRLDIDPEIRRHTDALTERLDAAMAEKRAAHLGAPAGGAARG